MKVGKLIKTRPRVRLRVPRTVAPGQTFTAELRLHAKREVDIAYVDVTLVGSEGWVHGESRANHDLCRLSARASEQRTLEKGNNELTVRCTIPENAPPSHAGTAAYVRYRMDVHVGIEWWPDVNVSFEIQVRAPDDEVGEGVPRIYTTNTSGPRGIDPHIECSLATDAVAPGGEVVGNITLYNVEHNAYRDVMLSLIARERLLHSNGAQAGHADSRYTSRIALQPRYDGESHSFRLRIPAAATPARSQRLWRLEWLFEIEARARKSAMLRFPIRMLPQVTVSDVSVRLAAPTIGQQRVATHWASVADRRGFTFGNMALKQSREAFELQIQREHRGDDGTFLVARFEYPPLRMELDVRPRKGLRRLGGVDIGESELAKRLHARGREDRQVSDLLRRLLPTLEKFMLERFDDTRLEIAREGSGHSEQALEHFVLDVLAVAEAWETARRELVAPKAMRGARGSWAELARRLRGRFDPSDMSVEGELDGSEIEVITRWQGTEPYLTELRYTPQDTIEPELCFDCDANDWKPQQLEQLGGEARALSEKLLGESSSLTVDEEFVALTIDGAQMDAGALLKRLRDLAALVALLRTEAGPYR